MNFLFDGLCSLITNISMGASLHCAIMFFEPEMPKSLREE